MSDTIGLSIFFTLIFLMLYVAIFSSYGIDKNYYEQYTDNLEIYSLQDTNSVSGGFFLGIGSVEQEWSYSYYYKYENGFKIGSVVSNDYVIIQQDDIIPQLRTLQHCAKENTSFMFIPIKKGECYNYQKQIVVPTDTIKIQYNLDAN